MVKEKQFNASSIRMSLDFTTCSESHLAADFLAFFHLLRTIEGQTAVDAHVMIKRPESGSTVILLAGDSIG
jgi:hypothetical protein